MESMPDAAQPLQVHLEAFTSVTELDVNLVDTFKAQLTDETQKTALPIFLPLLTKVLPITTNPTPLTQLLLKLLEHASFSDVLSLTTAAELVPTLNFPGQPIQIMGLKLIQKATASPTEASMLAAYPDLVGAIVNLALAATSTEVSSLASTILLDLLKADLTGPDGNGPGLMWRRVFQDKDIYSSIFNLCSWRSKTPSMNRSEKTLAQARLLAMIPTMASLDWDMVSMSHFPQIEDKFEGNGLNGLLSFAESMVDTNFDVLMYMTVIDFFAAFILCGPTPTKNGKYSTSKGLEYLIEKGRHEATLNLYLIPAEEQADQFTASFLTSRSARYVATYVSNFPSHMLASKNCLSKILKAIESYLPPPANKDPHSPSLHLLTSLPPSELGDVVLKIPFYHPEYIATLGTLLPLDEKLYKRYLASNPSFYKKALENASIVALKEAALASLQLLDNLSRTPFGLKDILDDTPIMQFLVTTPQRFALNAGHGGDEEAAGMIARKRWEVVDNIATGLSKSDPNLESQRRAWEKVVVERAASGVWGGIGTQNGAGSRVGWEGA